MNEINSVLEKYVEQVKEEQKKFEECKVKIGFAGQSGVGKSSLINSIIGKRVAKTGSTETTEEKQAYSYNGMDLFDLPGCGTTKFPIDTYIERFNLKELDAFIIVVAHRIYKNDIYLYEELTKMGIPCFVVRTQIDKVIEDEQYNEDEPRTEEEILKEVRENLSGEFKTDKIYLVSSRANPFELPLLLEDIEKSLNDIKKERFIADCAVLSTKILEEKLELAKKIVLRQSILAATNGLNPIPGLDISVDVSILIQMTNEINEIFGLQEEELKYIERKFPQLGTSEQFKQHKQAAIQMLAKYATKEAVIKLLARYGTALAGKEIGKYIPFIGQVLAAGVGYKLTSYFGEEYYIEAKEKAELLLNDITYFIGE